MSGLSKARFMRLAPAILAAGTAVAASPASAAEAVPASTITSIWNPWSLDSVAVKTSAPATAAGWNYGITVPVY